MTTATVEQYISYPNYNTIVRSCTLMYHATYSTLEDIIRVLYGFEYNPQNIRELYAIFHESGYMMDTLKNVRAVVLQIHSDGVRDSICVLDNSENNRRRSERVIYIKMYDFEKYTRKNNIVYAILYIVLGLFAITGIYVSLKTISLLLTPN